MTSGIVHRAPRRLIAGSARRRGQEDPRAGRRGLKFAARGNGHSTFGRSQVELSVVADVSQLRDIGTVEGDRVVVGAGKKWSDVLSVMLAQGMTPPVLTDYLELSVGGTLVVGGVGGTTSTFGVQSRQRDRDRGRDRRRRDDHLLGGRTNPDLFDAVRAGLGQVGVVTAATLGLVPAPESVRRFLLAYPDLGAMLADARALAGDGRFGARAGRDPCDAGRRVAFRLDVTAVLRRQTRRMRRLLAVLSDDAAGLEDVDDRDTARTVPARAAGGGAAGERAVATSRTRG